MVGAILFVIVHLFQITTVEQVHFVSVFLSFELSLEWLHVVTFSRSRFRCCSKVLDLLECLLMLRLIVCGGYFDQLIEELLLLWAACLRRPLD